jgi:aminoglycoside phosphotransferase (APT) family kinase protein
VAPPVLPDLADLATQRDLLVYLRSRWVPSAVLDGIKRADGGFSSETWFVDLQLNGRAETLVLRRQAFVGPLEPYDLAREVGVLQALAGTGVPVPAVRFLCEDTEVVGAPFVLMERIDGDVPDYRNLPEFPPWRDSANRRAMARELLRVLACIQDVDWRADSFLNGLLPALPTPTAPPVLARVAGILAKLELQVGTHGIPPVLTETAAWLVDNAPARPADWVLVHGDYRVGNLIWRDNAILAVLDWEGAGIGDPLEDLGYACHPIARVRAPELMAMLVPLPELAQIYERETGRTLDLPRLHFYLIYALYFHLYTLVSGIVSATNGADLRVALGYAKLDRVTRELISHMEAFEAGRHVL